MATQSDGRYERAFLRLEPEKQQEVIAQLAAGFANLRDAIQVLAPAFAQAMQLIGAALQPLHEAIAEIEAGTHDEAPEG